MNKLTLLIHLILLPAFAIAQKITLQFVAMPTSTPSVSAAKLRYDKAFAYSFTFDDATSDAFHVALPFFKGGTIAAINTPSAGLFFTDGCGNDVPFRAGIAWNSVNQYGQDVHLGNVSGLLTWTELDSLYRADWDVLSHSNSHRARWSGTMTDADYDHEINQNRINVRQKTQKTLEMPLFVVPSGDIFYQDRALLAEHKAVFDQNFQNLDIPLTGVLVNDVPNLTNYKMYRGHLDAMLLNNQPERVNSIASETQGGTVYKWWTEFTHRIDNFDGAAPFNYYKFRDHMTGVAQNYGKNGTDKMWFAPLQTVFEYLQMRQNVSFTSQIVSGNRLEIDVNLSGVPTWLRRRTLTLVVNADANFNQVLVPSGVVMTFRGTGNRKIINLDFTNYNASLPIELSDFSGKQAENGSVQLTWRTSLEVNLTQFEVEKSNNGKDFKGIGTVAAKGRIATKTFTDYVFSDVNFKENAYYRLRQLYADGKADYSKILAVSPLTSRPIVKITPSVSDDFWLVDSDIDDLRRAQIDVFDANGCLVLSQKGTEKRIQTTTFARGLYVVKVTIGQQFWVRKMVKF